MKKVVEVNKILILIGFILISLASVSANSGIWISNSELATLPASGTAWLNMKNEADQSSCIPALSNQDDNCNVRVLAQALVFAKLRQETYRTKVVSALTSIVNSGTYNGRSLALGRELGAYVISADLVDLNSFNPTLDTQFRNKIRELLTTPTSGGPVNIEDCHEKRPNNWGTMCCGSRAAVAAYLNDDAKLDRVAQVFKGYLGDRSSYVSFSYGDLSWQCNPSQPVGINPIGCIKEGHSIDGVMPDDQRRCGSFSWPPCNTGYAWEGQQGILFEAIILSRQGYDVWNWEDRAILRAHAWKVNVGNNQAGGDDTWQPWVVNYYYNTNFPAPSPSNPGKNIGWTDWTHQGNAQPLQSCSQQNGLCCGAGFTCSGNAIPSSDCNTICCLGSCQTPPQDTTPPTVSVNHNPTTNIQTTTSVNIIATATDQSGISNIEIFVDGSSRRTCTSSPCSYSSTYNAGSHSYYATARDIPCNQGRDPLTGSKSFNVISGTCTTGQWQNQGCGEGSCTSSQMYQTRTVNPNGCAVTDQCVSDPSCTTSPVCGNNIREGTEQCDGSDLASQTCQSLGFSSGTLSCSASCTFNTNSCTGAISPIIIWDPPTPADGASINQNSVSLSTTITDNTNTAALFDWDNSLIGYWPMDTYTTLGINDKSTHNNFASFAGSLNTNSLASNGKFGKAFTFGGSSDFLKITDSNEFEGMDELTISAWINPTSGQSDQRIIFKSNTYMLRLNSGKISFRIYNAGSSADVNTLSTISLGTWSHIVTTFDGNTMRVYINGVQESTTNTISGPIRNVISSGGIAIGNNHAGGAAFNGLIDEVVILRRALSLEEIKALYDNGANRLSHSFTGLSERTYNYGAYAIDSEGNLNINRRSVIINFQQQCTTGQWQNQGCGEGSCTSSQMYQTRTVNPNGCAVTDQCVSDPSCTTSPVCGNNIREGTEQCDGSDLASQTCQSLGFSSGTLSCSASCTFNTNSCTGAISPIIIWDPPTPADGASINQNSVSLSTTITDNTNTAALFDWDNSLIGYWPMDTYTTLGINDKSTHNNFASFAGSLNTNSLASNGKFGKAFTFGGSSDFLKITDSNEFEGMDELTISAWINPTSGQSDQRIIFKSNTYMLRLNSGKISFRIYNAGSSADVNTLSTISLGTWSHIVTT